MNRCRSTVLFAAVGFATISTSCAAQERQDARVVDLASARFSNVTGIDWSERSNLLTNTSDSASLQAKAMAPSLGDRPGRAAMYIGIGAVIGGLATVGVVVAAFTSSDEECICSPVGVIPIVVIGTAIGGGIGAIVYAINH